MDEALDFLSRPANVAYNWLVMTTEHSQIFGMTRILYEVSWKTQFTYQSSWKTRISYEDSLENSAFFKMLLAVQFGLKRVLAELLKTHTRPAEDTLDPVIGRLACHAAGLGYREIVKLLLTKGDVDWNMSNFYGKKLVVLVAEWEDEDIMRTLLQKESCSVNALTNSESALYWATRNGSTSIARMLLEAGADVEAAGGRGLSVIAEATPYLILHECWDEMMDLLLEYKADVNAQSICHGYTPLHSVARYSFMDTHLVVEYLVSKGADLNLPDLRGNTPLDLAEVQRPIGCRYNQETATKIIQVLREAGGKTAREMIEQPGGLAAWEATKARQCARIEDHSEQLQPRSPNYWTNLRPPPEHRVSFPREPLVLQDESSATSKYRICLPRETLMLQNVTDTSTMQCETCKLYGHSLPLPKPDV